ncbi:MAG: hypothetical protein QMB77_05955 [Aliarcobacter cryaerophilus]
MIKKIKNIYKIFGPGILMATAAIGGSHLVSSTQAGALFGWSLAKFFQISIFFSKCTIYNGYKKELN